MDREWFVAFVERWYWCLLDEPAADGDERSGRIARLDRAFAEVWRLRRKVTSETDRLGVIGSMLGEPVGAVAGRGGGGVCPSRSAAEELAARLMRRAQRRQLVVTAVMVLAVAGTTAAEVMARR